MSAVKFLFVRFGKVDVERLTLVDVRTTISGHLDDDALRDLPDRLVQSLYVIGDAVNVLHIAAE